MGSSTSARGIRARDREPDRMSSSGRVKLAVLPVPVWATPITSRPISTNGIACAWIGVGWRYPFSVTARTSSSDRPISENRGSSGIASAGSMRPISSSSSSSWGSASRGCSARSSVSPRGSPRGSESNGGSPCGTGSTGCSPPRSASSGCASSGAGSRGCAPWGSWPLAAAASIPGSAACGSTAGVTGAADGSPGASSGVAGSTTPETAPPMWTGCWSWASSTDVTGRVSFNTLSISPILISSILSQGSAAVWARSVG